MTAAIEWDFVNDSGLHESGLKTVFREMALHKNGRMSGERYPTALENGIGGNIVHFNAGGKSANLMLTEAPPKKAIDLWLDSVFKYNIEVFVTLTNDGTEHSVGEHNDLDPAKLAKYRAGQPIDLHHVRNLKHNATRYQISNEHIVEKTEDFEVWQCSVGDGAKLRLLTQIKVLNLKDSVGISELSDEDLVERFTAITDTIVKYAPNLNAAFNCFMGVGRARFTAFAFLVAARAAKEGIDSLINNTVSFPYPYPEAAARFIRSIGE